MPTARKVILFIVEGTTDREALSGVLANVFTDSRLVFKIIYGDITTNKNVTQANVLGAITGHIRYEMDIQGFEAGDIERIAQLVDTDGCFIPQENILYQKTPEPLYTQDAVIVENVVETQERFKKKATIVSKLATREFLTIQRRKVPYSVYFMSRNLEHALHDRAETLPDEEKGRLARLFDRRYANDVPAFRSFINGDSLAVPGGYGQTWEFIRQGVNSLRRHSNLHCLVNAYA